MTNSETYHRALLHHCCESGAILRKVRGKRYCLALGDDERERDREPFVLSWTLSSASLNVQSEIISRCVLLVDSITIETKAGPTHSV